MTTHAPSTQTPELLPITDKNKKKKKNMARRSTGLREKQLVMN